jgi:hypothetical protein
MLVVPTSLPASLPDPADPALSPSSHHPPHHSGGAAPPGVSELLSAQVEAPLAQCLVLSSWLTLMVGCAAPYHILHRLERRARKWFEARQSPPPQQQAQRPDDADGEPRLLAPALHLYVTSSVVWLVACGVYGTAR